MSSNLDFLNNSIHESLTQSNDLSTTTNLHNIESAQLNEQNQNENETSYQMKPIKFVKKSKDKQKRCAHCNKKLKLIETISGKCKCEQIFCKQHLFAGEHKCTYDYRESSKQILAKMNPRVVADKLHHRI